MRYDHLGDTGLVLSRVGLGSWLIFTTKEQDQCNDLHRKAWELGINFYDTANQYHNGDAELAVGEALSPFPRETYVLATKLFWPLSDHPFPTANDRGLSRKQIFNECHKSLKRLQTDHIDLYQCHRYDELTPLDETCWAMHDLITQGKVLYWGVSEWTAAQIEDAHGICRANGWHRPVSNQPVLNLLQRHWEDECFPVCEKNGMGVVNFSPLCQGLLTGKYDDGMPEDSRGADEEFGKWLRPLMTDGTMDKVRSFTALCRDHGLQPAQVALAWCHSVAPVTSTIVGATKVSQLEQNASAADLDLDPELLGAVESIFAS